MPEIEFHQLELSYQGLRIATAAGRRRLLAALASKGQQSPVLVVERAEGCYALIDGYQRVEALRKLGLDSVLAMVLPLDEAEALILWHRQQSSARRSAFEDAWLLGALVEHGLSQHELACRLGHTTSWVSRRLGLLNALPKTVQQMVRQGRLSAYSAMKYLVPLARANGTDCQKLAEAVAGHPISTRQMERLYVAWRSSDAEGRARLVDEPLLFLKAAREMEQAEPPHPDAALARDLEALGTMTRRIMRRLSRRRPEFEEPQELALVRSAARASMNALMGMMEEKSDDRQRPAQDRLAPVSRQGDGQTNDCQSAEDVAQYGA